MHSRKRSRAGVRRGLEIYVGPVVDRIRLEFGTQIVMLTAEEAVTLASEIMEVAKHIEVNRGWGSTPEQGEG